MRLYPLAYMAGLLPLITINLTYWLSASTGEVAWCVPYIDSCTSISATGRQPPAYYVFKALMIPAALLLMLYWVLNVRWLKLLGCAQRGWLTSLLGFGLVSGIGLIFYTVLLGSITPEFKQPRHTGVLAFFGFTFFAQLLITALMQRIPLLKRNFRRRLALLTALMAVDLLLGIGNLLAGFINPVLYDAINDALAWNFTLLLCLHVILTAELWRATHWRLRFSVIA